MSSITNSSITTNNADLSKLERGEIQTHLNSSAPITEIFTKCNTYIYAHTSPLARNLTRVTIAGSLSCVGGVIAGEPRIVGVLGIAALYFGSALGGVGNGLSTWLMWETPTEKRVNLLEQDVNEIKKRMG